MSQVPPGTYSANMRVNEWFGELEYVELPQIPTLCKEQQEKMPEQLPPLRSRNTAEVRRCFCFLGGLLA